MSCYESRPPLLPSIEGMLAAISNCPYPSPSIVLPNKQSSISIKHISFLATRETNWTLQFLQVPPYPPVTVNPNRPFSRGPFQ